MDGLMSVVAWMTRGLRKLLAGLLFIESQRAEYLADHLAAKVAGSVAVAGLLRKLGLAHNLKAVAERAYYSGDTDGRTVIDSFRAFVASVPAREMERIKRADERENARIDSTHPPTAMRIRFMESRGPAIPSVILDEAQSAAIDVELHTLNERLSMKIMGQYFD